MTNYPATARLRLVKGYTYNGKSFPAGTEFDATYSFTPGGYAWYEDTRRVGGVGPVVVGENAPVVDFQAEFVVPAPEWVQQDDWSKVEHDQPVRFTLDDNVLVATAYRDAYPHNIDITVGGYIIELYKSAGWKLEVVKPEVKPREPGFYTHPGFENLIFRVEENGDVYYANHQRGKWTKAKDIFPREDLVKVTPTP